jgi:hypothetical protein
MIESFRTHPFTRAVCLEVARLFAPFTLIAVVTPAREAERRQ